MAYLYRILGTELGLLSRHRTWVNTWPRQVDVLDTVPEGYDARTLGYVTFSALKQMIQVVMSAALVAETYV